MTVPFCDASRAELVARVAYQLVLLQWKHTKEYQPTPGQTIRSVETLPFVKASLDFRLALSSMYLEVVTNKRRSRDWLRDAINRSRSGVLFRAVFYAEYKAGRRDPRVTNRGVGLRQASIPGTELAQLGGDRNNGE